MLLPTEYTRATVKYISLVQAALQPGPAPCSCNKSKDSHGCICTAGVGAYSGHNKVGGFGCGALMLPQSSLSLLGLGPCSFRSITLSLETLSEVLRSPQYLCPQHRKELRLMLHPMFYD